MNSPESLSSNQSPSEELYSTVESLLEDELLEVEGDQGKYINNRIKDLIRKGLEKEAEEEATDQKRYESHWARLEDVDEYNKTGYDRMEELESNQHSTTGKKRNFDTKFGQYLRTKVKDEDGNVRTEYAEEQAETIKFANVLEIWTEFVPKSELPLNSLSQEMTSAEINKLYYDYISNLMAKLPRGENEKLKDYRERVKSFVESNWDSLLQDEYLRTKKSQAEWQPNSRHMKEEDKLRLEGKWDRIAKSGDLSLFEDMQQVNKKLDRAVEEGKINEDLAKRLRDRQVGRFALEHHLEPSIQKWYDEEMKNIEEWAKKPGYSKERIEELKESLKKEAEKKQKAFELEQIRIPEQPQPKSEPEPTPEPTPEPEPEPTPEPEPEPTPEPEPEPTPTSTPESEPTGTSNKAIKVTFLSPFARPRQETPDNPGESQKPSKKQELIRQIKELQKPQVESQEPSKKQELIDQIKEIQKEPQEKTKKIRKRGLFAWVASGIGLIKNLGKKTNSQDGSNNYSPTDERSSWGSFGSYDLDNRRNDI